MTPALTAFMPAHNPRMEVLAWALDALRAQDLDPARWEFLMVDNASDPPLEGRVDLAGLPGARIVREERLGLTPARIAGFRAARGAVVVMVDDDNALAQDYLSNALALMESEPRLGAVGGRSIPEYESPPPDWFAATGIRLACRDFGDAAMRAEWRTGDERCYPDCAPIGAGMVVRRCIGLAYAEAAESDPARLALDRAGGSLASGGDNDLAMTALDGGWQVGYDPALRLAHRIPAGRLERGYLERMAEDSFRTWVRVLDLHGIRPWRRIAPWQAPLLKAKHWIRTKPWRGPVESIRYRGIRGQIDGRARLK